MTLITRGPADFMYEVKHMMAVSRRIAALGLALAAGIGLSGAHGQTASTMVTYPAGWNMVAVSDLINGTLSAPYATPLWTYGHGAYSALSPAGGAVNPNSPLGAWAYFPGTATLTIPAPTRPNDLIVDALAPGWNIVGNPFPGQVALPGLTGGEVAYAWDPVSATYHQVTQIPNGDAVWVYSPAATTTSLSLTTPVS